MTPEKHFGTISIRRARDIYSGAVLVVGKRRCEENADTWGGVFGLALALPQEMVEDILRDGGRAAVKRLYERAESIIRVELTSGVGGWPPERYTAYRGGPVRIIGTILGEDGELRIRDAGS